jgi:hypothetical protein
MRDEYRYRAASRTSQEMVDVEGAEYQDKLHEHLKWLSQRLNSSQSIKAASLQREI